MEKVFGDTEWVTCWRLRWLPTPEELLSVIDQLINLVGMESDGDPDIRSFPNADGKGGKGCQIYRALTDSYVMAGTWEDLGITRILLSSCKPYLAKAAGNFLKKVTSAPVLKAGYFDF
jgi:hypothetical protein